MLMIPKITITTMRMANPAVGPPEKELRWFWHNNRAWTSRQQLWILKTAQWKLKEQVTLNKPKWQNCTCWCHWAEVTQLQCDYRRWFVTMTCFTNVSWWHVRRHEGSELRADMELRTQLLLLLLLQPVSGMPGAVSPHRCSYMSSDVDLNHMSLYTPSGTRPQCCPVFPMLPSSSFISLSIWYMFVYVCCLFVLSCDITRTPLTLVSGQTYYYYNNYDYGIKAAT